MLNEAEHADDQQLEMLVFGDENSDEYRAASAHVENCEVCRSKLDALTGLSQIDAEASEMFAGYCLKNGLIRPRLEATAGPRPQEDTSLDFLGPPSHPEMLGRIGRYEVEQVIGSGGMGVVLKAFDTELNRPVAIKVLARHLAHSGAARLRFAREAKAAAAVVHEHVVSIHNVESEEESPFIVMQYVAGESLQSRVEREGPLDAKAILRIAIQAAAGLAEAHAQGVIHRDVKPANILLEDGVERVLLTDFGLARTVDDASLTHTGVVAGTPHYMSPEQANGKATDHRTDLFSLGSALYFMATGHPPFRAERAMGVLHRICHDQHRPAWEVNPDLPDELCDVIDRLLEKRMSRRISSAGELRIKLTQLLAKVQERGYRRRGYIARFMRSHRAIRWGLTMSAVLACTAFAVAWIHGSMDKKTGERRHDSNVASELSHEILAADDIAFDAASEEAARRIRRLGAMSSDSSFLWPTSNDFHQHLESIEARLSRIQADPFPASPTNLDEGK